MNPKDAISKGPPKPPKPPKPLKPPKPPKAKREPQPANRQQPVPRKDAHADFFIGYKKVPTASRRFFLLSMPLLLAGGTGLGVLLARSQLKPDATNWGKEVITLDGMLVADPYPHLLVANPSAAAGYDAVFLVKRGKYGAQALATGKTGTWVRTSGKLISRHDTASNYMLEATDLQPLAQSARTPPGEASLFSDKTSDLGFHTLRGRIMDSKCYFGVMKPAEGITHKACAALCVRGGIPPFFVPYGEAADRVIVVANEQGIADFEFLLPHILDPVELRGKLVAVNNHYQLHVAAADIRSLVSLNC